MRSETQRGTNSGVELTDLRARETAGKFGQPGAGDGEDVVEVGDAGRREAFDAAERSPRRHPVAQGKFPYPVPPAGPTASGCPDSPNQPES